MPTLVCGLLCAFLTGDRGSHSRLCLCIDIFFLPSVHWTSCTNIPGHKTSRRLLLTESQNVATGNVKQGSVKNDSRRSWRIFFLFQKKMDIRKRMLSFAENSFEFLSSNCNLHNVMHICTSAQLSFCEPLLCAFLTGWPCYHSRLFLCTDIFFLTFGSLNILVVQTLLVTQVQTFRSMVLARARKWQRE